MSSSTSRILCSLGTAIIGSCFLLVNAIPAMAELVVTDELSVGVDTGRILPDQQSGKFWVVAHLQGLILVSEDESGVWGIEHFEGYEVLDAVGPDSQGYIYCTYTASGPPHGVVIFDCINEQFSRTIDFPWSGASGIVISPDEQRLYVTIHSTDQGADSPDEASENSGLVIEVDIVSGNVLRTCSVRAWPGTICLWNDDALLVSCQKQYWEANDRYEEMKSTTDVIALDTFTKIAEIPSNFAEWPETNDLQRWGESSVALFNLYLYSDFEDPKYGDAIWLIDPETGAVADSIRVEYLDGDESGVLHAFISEKCPGLMYLSLAGYDRIWEFPVIVADTCGNYVDHAVTPPGFTPSFICEIDDHRIMVTDWLTDKVCILEWVNHPPICALELLTPMPYIGPSPALIEFNAAASYDPDPCDELMYEWDFDGDHVFGEPVDDAYTGFSVAPTHAYTEDYRGYVYLKVSDGRGGESICGVEVSAIVQ